jgi:hypothetical protein
MSSDGSPSDIPAEYASVPKLKEAWEEGFAKMRQAIRGTPVEAKKVARKKTSAKTEVVLADEPEEEIPEEAPKGARDMLSIYYSKNPDALSLQDCT